MSLKDRLMGVYNLSQRGVGGEKENAKKILQRLLAANNMTLQDFLNKKGILDPEIIPETINEASFYYSFVWPYLISDRIIAKHREKLIFSPVFRLLPEGYFKQQYVIEDYLRKVCIKEEEVEIQLEIMFSRPWDFCDEIIIRSSSNTLEGFLWRYGFEFLKKQEVRNREEEKNFYEDLGDLYKKYRIAKEKL